MTGIPSMPGRFPSPGAAPAIVRKVYFAYLGGTLIFSSIIVGLLAAFIAGWSAKIARDQSIQLPGLIAMMLRHRLALPLFTLPSLLLGILCIGARRLNWLWFALGLLWLILAACAVIVAFISVLAPLYEPRPL